MEFAFRAMRDTGELVADRVEALTSSEALEMLRHRGLTVLQLGPGAGGVGGAVAPFRDLFKRFRRPRTNDVLIFTRQMKMMLESGAPLVTALEAAEQQSGNLGFRNVVRALREHIEGGAPLSTGFEPHSALFPPVFRSLISAGEATATLPMAFARLSDLGRQQQQVRRTLIGAITYPAILTVMLIATVFVMVLFVVPRFRQLFTQLNAKLPFTTEIVITISELAVRFWPAVIGAILLPVALGIAIVRIPALRQRFDLLMIRLPLIGRVVRRLVMARVLRVWGSLLRSHVPLLESVEHARSAARFAPFEKLIDEVRDSVSSGGRVGRALASSGLVEPIVATAIATGEEHGRLAESIEFVADWMDEDNSHTIATGMRLLEPMFLGLMGLLVGFIAMSLFMPLFDAATAAH